MMLRGDRLPLGDHEAVGGDAECRVVMEAVPPTPFVVVEPSSDLSWAGTNKIYRAALIRRARVRGKRRLVSTSVPAGHALVGVHGP